MTKDYFSYSLKNRLTIFNYTLYLNIIEEYIIDYINDWNLLTIDNKVPNKKSYYYNFLYKVLEKEVLDLLKTQKSTHSKSIIIINLNNKGKFYNKFENYKKFLNDNIKILKKLHNNVIFTDLSFVNTNGKYKGINSLSLNGDEVEFLQKFS
jgi:hypothetical protein